MPIDIQTVQPGDLITSAFFNELIEQLETLDARVTALEGAPGPGDGTGNVVITAMSPSPAREGEDLTIVGANFGFSIGAHRVRFNGVQPPLFRSGSGDSVLICEVPELPGLADTGSPVTLTVSNAISTVTRVITVLPAVPAPLGNIDTLFDGATPDPLTAGMDNEFAFKLSSDASVADTLVVTPRVEVGGADAGWATAVLDSSHAEIATQQITLAPAEEKAFFVRVTIPSGTNGTDFVLTVDSVGTHFESSSGDLEVTVGQSADPDPTITLSPSASPNVSGSTITAALDEIVQVNVEATFSVVGTYDVSLTKLTGTTNWTTPLINPPAGNPVIIIDADDLAAVTPAPRTIQFRVRPNAGASDPGQLRLVVQRQGETRSRTRTFDLNVSP
jgi:IPT/TIG domain